jgi:hypothetical protein
MQETNALFVNFFVVDDSSKYCAEIEAGMCQKIFSENPNVDYIVWVFPNKVRYICLSIQFAEL